MGAACKASCAACASRPLPLAPTSSSTPCRSAPEFMGAACKESCAACTFYYLPDAAHPYIVLGEPGLLGPEDMRRKKVALLKVGHGARGGRRAGGGIRLGLAAAQAAAESRC
jgi:hypothetical protein